MVITDRDGRIAVFNAAAEGLFGCGRSRVTGSDFRALLPEADTDSSRRFLEQSLAARPALGQDRGGRELMLRRHDGTEVPVAMWIREFEFEGRPSLWINLQDLSQRRAMEDMLAQTQRLEALGQLTGGIAHDFNNLLTVIQGNLHLIRRRVEGDETAVQWIDVALKATRRGTELTRQLLAYARRQALSPQPVDVNRLCSGLSEMLVRALEGNIDLSLNLDPGLWQARIDPGRLEDAILNLAINARDAMPQGGKLMIETSNVSIADRWGPNDGDITPGDYVEIAVSDTGHGMTPSVVGRAFDPFFTTRGDVGRSGLGLSMVFGFVKQSGGHIRIYSEVDTGTTVRLHIPRAGAEAGQAEAASGEVLDAGGKEIILVVEDDPDVRTYISTALSAYGYTVLSAPSAEVAERILGQDGGSIDMLVSDVMLGQGRNGVELARAARDSAPGIGLLLISGYTRDALAAGQTLPAGLEVLSKPFTPETLAQRVRATLDRKARS